MTPDINIKSGETEDEYFGRLYSLKSRFHLRWSDIADMVNKELGYSYGPDKYRKSCKKCYDEYYNDDYLLSSNDETNDIEEERGDSISDKITKLHDERVKLSDERSQLNAMYRTISRENTLKEMAMAAAETIANSGKFVLPTRPSRLNEAKSENTGILLVSDWHYGITINNYFNVYSPEIAIERVKKLQERVIDKCVSSGITELNVVNLGDLIAGNIHLPIRINSRVDVITQIIKVSEIYAEFLSNLSEYANINAYSVLDNHSRIDPNKKDSIQLESLARITDWYLAERLKDSNISLYKNDIDYNIASFSTNGYNIIGVHGDLDKMNKMVDNLTTFTGDKYDLIVSAHNHHFSTDERNGTVVVSNGSLMGTDEYAFKLRLNSKPSQTFIVTNKNSVCDEIHRIVLD